MVVNSYIGWTLVHVASYGLAHPPHGFGATLLSLWMIRLLERDQNGEIIKHDRWLMLVKMLAVVLALSFTIRSDWLLLNLNGVALVGAWGLLAMRRASGDVPSSFTEVLRHLRHLSAAYMAALFRPVWIRRLPYR